MCFTLPPAYMAGGTIKETNMDSQMLTQSCSTLSKVSRADIEDTHKLRDAMHDSPYLAALVQFGADYPSILDALVRRIPLELR